MLYPPVENILPRPEPDPPAALLDSGPREIVVAVKIGRHAVVLGYAEYDSELARSYAVTDLHFSCHFSSL